MHIALKPYVWPIFSSGRLLYMYVPTPIWLKYCRLWRKRTHKQAQKTNWHVTSQKSDKYIHVKYSSQYFVRHTILIQHFDFTKLHQILKDGDQAALATVVHVGAMVKESPGRRLSLVLWVSFWYDFLTMPFERGKHLREHARIKY